MARPRRTRGTQPCRGALAVLAMLLTVLAAAPSAGVGADGPDPILQDTSACPQPGHPSPSPTGAADGQGYFTENLGQWDDDVRFVARVASGRAGLCSDGVVHDVAGPDGGCRVKVAFVTDEVPEPYGVGDAGHPTSYFLGNDPEGWVKGARSYREVVYPGVWPGVDVRYRFEGGDLKYDLLLDGDAEVSAIRFRAVGAESMKVEDDRLSLGLPDGSSVQDGDLVAWYGDMETVSVRFVRDGDTFGFQADAEPGRAMVIDPVVVHSSTLAGSSYADSALDVAVDGGGNLVIASAAGSTDFPTTPGAYSDQASDGSTAVTKLNHNGSRVLWSAIIGGSSADFLQAMDVDEEGNVYIAGTTWSDDYPVTENAPVGEFNLGMNNNQLDGTLSKLSSSGDSLVYSTYVGGSSTEWLDDVKVWNGQAAVVGSTHSHDFPTESGPFGGVHGDGFLVIFEENGSGIADTCFWGGFGSEHVGTLAFDRNGDVVVGGRTSSVDLYTTPGVFQPTSLGWGGGFVSRYSPSEGKLVMSTYFSSPQGGSVGRVAVDDDLNIYVSGGASGIPGDGFITTPGAFDRELNGYTDAFLAKLDPNATRLEYCTLLGGDGEDETVYDIEVDDQGNLVAVGALEVGTNFTVTPGCHDPVWKGDSEGFIFVLDENGSAPVYSSFHGGERADVVNSVVIDDVDNWVVAGSTDSIDLPLTDDAFQGRLSGSSDSFVSIIGEHLPTSAPRNLTAEGREGQIHLEWEFPSEDNGYPVRRFVLFRGISDDDLRFYRTLDPSLSFTDRSVEWGVRYHYALRASNGKGLSPMSNVANARSVTVPDGPANLTGTVGIDHVLLEWEPPVFTGGLPLTGFMLYRTAEGDPLETATPLDAGATSFEDGLVEDGTEYTYAITAMNEYGGSRQLVSVTLRTHDVPSPPQGLDHTYGDLFINVTWNPPVSDNGLPLTGFLVYRREGDGPEELVDSLDPSTLSFVDAHVSVGVRYTYHVQARNAKGPSDPSEGLEAMVMVAPDPPVDVEVIATGEFVKVTWSPPDFDGATPVLGYRVYLVTSPAGSKCLGGPVVAGDGPAPLSFLHDVAYDGTARSYFVTAVNGEGESGPSEVATTMVYRPPDAPSAPRLTWGDGSVAIEWDPPASDGGTPLLSYTVHRRAEGEDSFSPLVELETGETSFHDSGLPNGVAHHYRVSATNLVGESAPSPESSTVPAGRPGSPSGLKAEGLPGVVRLTWEPPVDDGGHPVSGYTVHRMTSEGSMETVDDLDGSIHQWDDGAVTAGVVHTYAVTARTDAGVSPQGETASATPYGPPDAPTGLVAQWVDGRVQLSWSAPLFDGGVPILGYGLRRQDGNGTNVTELSPVAVTYMDLDVGVGGTYRYTIYAYNAAGNGTGTDVSITVPMPEPPSPESSGGFPWALLVLALVLLVAAAVLVLRRGRAVPPGRAML